MGNRNRKISFTSIELFIIRAASIILLIFTLLKILKTEIASW